MSLLAASQLSPAFGDDWIESDMAGLKATVPQVNEEESLVRDSRTGARRAGNGRLLKLTLETHPDRDRVFEYMMNRYRGVDPAARAATCRHPGVSAVRSSCSRRRYVHAARFSKGGFP